VSSCDDDPHGLPFLGVSRLGNVVPVLHHSIGTVDR
jgi:hypothetical protein